MMLDPYIPEPYIQGMNKLATYLKEHSLTQKRFAASVRVKQATISRVMGGQIRPSLELAVKIERVTAGAVPAASWVPVEIDEQGAIAP